LIDIPPEKRLKTTIKSGSVYWFSEDNIKPKPHYLVVINHKPKTDENIILVKGSSQVEKIKKRKRYLSPKKTCVIVKKEEYSDFTDNTIFDCNRVYPYTQSEITQITKKPYFKFKPDMNEDIVDRLRDAVYESPCIENFIKELSLNKH